MGIYVVNIFQYQSGVFKRHLHTASGPSPIFSEDFKGRLKGRHFELSALSIGMTLEQNSITFYRDMEKKAGDPELKKLAAYLVKWEQSHLDALSIQSNIFQEENWQEAHFAPF